jgi:peptidoglycan-associated lipoprotein
MNRFLVTCGLVVVLSACGSSVKLDDVPVEDKKAVTVIAPQQTTPSDASGVAKSNVVPVDLSKSGQDSAMQSTNRIVYFDYDSFVIRPEFQSLIESHAKYIRSDKNRKVAIEGHTDERGGREYNLALGQKRAEAVKKSLSLLGVAESQLEAVSFGKEKPADSGNSEAAMQKNRRAEISYR